MGRKKWGTCNEEALRRRAAAWNVLQARAAGEPLGPVQDALLTRLVLPMTIIKRRAGAQEVYFSLGNFSWSALALPAVYLDGCYSFASPSSATWIVVTKLDDWVVVPYAVARVAGKGISARQDGPVKSLLENCLLTPAHNLVTDDLLLVASHLGLDAADGVTSGTSKEDLLNIIAFAVGGQALLDSVKALPKLPSDDVADLLVGDPLFEAAFEELDADDKLELSDIMKAWKKRKARRRASDDRFQQLKKRPRIFPMRARPKKRARSAPTPEGLPQPPPAAPAEEAPQPPPAAPAEEAPQPPAEEPPAAQRRRFEGEPFAGGRFAVAEMKTDEEVIIGYSCTCFLHPGPQLPGRRRRNRCNKTLTMGSTFTPEQAKRRIMKWCLDGVAIPSPGPDGDDIPRQLHMANNPRTYRDDEVPSLDALYVAANNL